MWLYPTYPGLLIGFFKNPPLSTSLDLKHLEMTGAEERRRSAAPHVRGNCGVALLRRVGVPACRQAGKVAPACRTPEGEANGGQASCERVEVAKRIFEIPRPDL